jgi:hypothetical protein
MIASKTGWILGLGATDTQDFRDGRRVPKEVLKLACAGLLCLECTRVLDGDDSLIGAGHRGDQVVRLKSSPKFLPLQLRGGCRA